MLAEPYICTKPGYRLGTIEWFSTLSDGRIGKDGSALIHQDAWQPYADFEREKMRELGNWHLYGADKPTGFFVCGPKTGNCYMSSTLTGYTIERYWTDSESSRVLERAAFLKAVCEKEGVEWLPANSEGGYILPPELNNDEGRERIRRACEGAKEIDVVKVLVEPEMTEGCTCQEDFGPASCPEHRPLPRAEFYTKEEVDRLLLQCLENALAHVDHGREEQRAWLRALLDYLQYVNRSMLAPGVLDKAAEDHINAVNDLRRRFL